jgi:hypothetical protein
MVRNRRKIMRSVSTEKTFLKTFKTQFMKGKYITTLIRLAAMSHRQKQNKKAA